MAEIYLCIIVSFATGLFASMVALVLSNNNNLKKRNMKNLRALNLTNEEFKLIIDGLDELPNKGAIGSMMGDLMIDMISDKEQGNPMISKMEHERDLRRRKEERKKQELSDKIKILQGKLLQFKNFLASNDLLAYKDTVDSN